jgi:hypothetical protein
MTKWTHANMYIKAVNILRQVVNASNLPQNHLHLFVICIHCHFFIANVKRYLRNF